MNQHRFAESGLLLARIIHAVQRGDRVSFLFGSALTAPGARGHELGVPGANTIIESVVASFKGTNELEALMNVVRQSDETSRYQEVMKFVIDCRGQDALNELIQTAVLKARLKPRKAAQTLEEIELDTDGWYLRPAVEAAGRIIVENPNIFSAPILTSNFDPLLEVSIRRAGAGATAIFLSADGTFLNVFAPNTTRIVHFHGYWHGSDTLHTPAQLTRNRPQLKSGLRNLLRETTVVVLGYGGWSDVFTRTLVDVIGEQSEQLNILWAFYSDRDDDIANRNDVLLKQFEALAGQRVVFYKGVDCHIFLPTLREKLLEIKPKTVSPDPLSSVILQQSFDVSASGDNPPQSSTWVGREEELRLMLSANSKVISITGLGGNGKSTLAAKYLALKEGSGDITVSYWADCREASNTLHTQLVRMVERVTKGMIRGVQLHESTTEDVIELLLETLGNTKAILVFDNIDKYVDVEQCKAVGTMDTLLVKALNHEHAAQFIFTTRPRLDYMHISYRSVQLSGLSLEESRKLFDVSGVVFDPILRPAVVSELHSLTRGHPLALTLIATQITKNKADVQALIGKLKAHLDAGIEHPIFPEIWDSLNEKQQTVLRYLAEQIHPDPEQRIANYLGNILNYNQFSKAIRTLKGMNLVVVKSAGPDSEETLELHPLIRDFIRRRFPREERLPYLDSIILFYDKMIGKLRPAISTAPFSILENWIAKIELSLERENYGDALVCLNEVRPTLQTNGYVEEFVRLAILVLSSFVPKTDGQEQDDFDSILEDLVHGLSDFGRYEEADKWLARFEATLVGKTARYILLCDMRTYRYWANANWNEAIAWGKKGVTLKSTTHLDTKRDCGHNLALAQRDDGDVATALKYFLMGKDLDSIQDVTKLDPKLGGAYYGNIGRCLQLQGKSSVALACLRKSGTILEHEKNAIVLMNLGFAAYWIGQLLEEEEKPEEAFAAYRRAAAKWKVSSPPNARKAMEASEHIRERFPKHLLPSDDWECERIYLNWLKGS